MAKATRPVKIRERARVVGTDHFDVYLDFSDGNPRHEDAREKLNHATGKRGDVLSYKMVMPRQYQNSCEFTMTDDTGFHVPVLGS